MQHQLLVCDMKLQMPCRTKRKFMPRPRIWRLKDAGTRSRFQEVFAAHITANPGAADTSEEIWANLKEGLLKTTEAECGMSKPHRWRKQTWWWNDLLDTSVKEKSRAFKAWKAGAGTRAVYDTAKRSARRAVHHAREEAEKGMFENINPHSPDIFRLANQMQRDDEDVVGEKPERKR